MKSRPRLTTSIMEDPLRLALIEPIILIAIVNTHLAMELATLKSLVIWASVRLTCFKGLTNWEWTLTTYRSILTKIVIICQKILRKTCNFSLAKRSNNCRRVSIRWEQVFHVLLKTTKVKRSQVSSTEITKGDLSALCKRRTTESVDQILLLLTSTPQAIIFWNLFTGSKKQWKVSKIRQCLCLTNLEWVTIFWPLLKGDRSKIWWYSSQCAFWPSFLSTCYFSMLNRIWEVT